MIQLLDPIKVPSHMEDKIHLEGFVSKKNNKEVSYRGSGDRQFLFVNSRPVDYNKGIN
jgi:DNA mismatch repair ATPase MutL